jgi:hypothetical protein
MNEEETLTLLDELTSHQAVTHACVVLPDRRVLSAARAGVELAGDKAWVALHDTFNLLKLHQLEGHTIKWFFERGCLVSVRTDQFIVGVLTSPAQAEQVAAFIRQRLMPVGG